MIRGKPFSTLTLGCKINQHETQALAESWLRAGGERLDGPEGAEVLLVNTCAVTLRAVSDSRAAIRRLHRAAPRAAIVVTGCAAETFPDEFTGLPGVVRVVPQSDKKRLLEDRSDFEIAGYHRARAVVRVQDGCSHGCAFCIVPITRGASVSRPVEDILAEARRLLEAGFPELVLSGINLRQFGRDLPGRPDFWDLLERMEREFTPEYAGPGPRSARIRISSLEPGQLTSRALEVLSGSSLVCRHLHLSLQSGDFGVLRAMGRGHYRPGQALSFCENLAPHWGEFGLGADLLVGFPGEDVASFERTYAFCKDLPLTYAHVFPFSPRPGTRAAAMADRPDPAEAKERAARLRGLVGRKKRDFLHRLLDRDELEVVVQDAEGRGVSAEYAPCRMEGPGGAAVPVRSLVRGGPFVVDQGEVRVAVTGPGEG